MKYSKSFVKTRKESKVYDSKNATLLIKAGYIHQTMSGVYSFLPLGRRVIEKITKIVKEEMDKLGEETLLSCLSPVEFWTTTNRLEKVDVLMKATPANEVSENVSKDTFILNPTHEDLITPLVQEFTKSYKDFPFAVYQVWTKFRNEKRSKSGLLRNREFLMKDLYSFHTSEEDLLNFYNNDVSKAYDTVYERLGLGEITNRAHASGGDFTDEFSREWQTKCEIGEDLIFEVPSTGEWFNQEVAPSKAREVPVDSELLPMEVVETPGITGIEELSEFLQVENYNTVKTLIYEAADGSVIVAAVRGDYDINEEKLKKVAGVSGLKLASDEIIKRVTGAEVGFAGIIGLPEDVRLYIDESAENLVNFMCGSNKTDYHNKNVNWDRDVEKPERFYDLKNALPGDIHPESGEKYNTFRGCEVGNIFPLNTKYSEDFGYKYTDDQGNEHLVYMGSYGIGISRLMGVMAEVFNDENGLMWPIQVAPYQVHLINIGTSDEVYAQAEEIYKQLQSEGIEVLWDERDDVSPGVKFNDADLIGIPIRVLISERSLAQTSAETKLRIEKESENIPLESLLEWVKEKIHTLEQ